MDEEVIVWYDREADYLEVLFKKQKGFFTETEHDAVMKKVDVDGKLLGFSILRVSAWAPDEPVSVALSSSAQG